MIYLTSAVLLLFALWFRKLVLGSSNTSTINFFLLVGWLIALLGDMVYAALITNQDLGIYAFMSVIIISAASVVSALFVKISVVNKNKLRMSTGAKQMGHISLVFLFLLLVVFVGTSIFFVKNYITVLVRVGFQFNVLHARENRSEILYGLWAYGFMLGIPLMLILPFTNFRHKKIFTIFILTVYLLNTRRAFFIISTMIFAIQNLTYVTRRIKLSRLAFMIIPFVIFFNWTQLLLNKSMYNNLISNYDPFTARIYSILMDPLVYIVGNINNIDYYVSMVPENRIMFEKTLYAFFSVLNNLGLAETPYIPNPFIQTGFFSTNTVAFSTYYLSDGGVIFTSVMVLIIMLFNEIVSAYKTRFNFMIKPLLIANAILSFRQNETIKIYFYITIIVVWLADKVSQKYSHRLH